MNIRDFNSVTQLLCMFLFCPLFLLGVLHLQSRQLPRHIPLSSIYSWCMKTGTSTRTPNPHPGTGGLDSTVISVLLSIKGVNRVVVRL